MHVDPPPARLLARAKLVEPKRKALKAAEDALAETMAQLKEKQDKLKAVQDNVAALEAQLQAAMDEQQSLKDQAELTVQRLARARSSPPVWRTSKCAGKRRRMSSGITRISSLARLHQRGVHRVLRRLHRVVPRRAREQVGGAVQRVGRARERRLHAAGYAGEPGGDAGLEHLGFAHG